MAPSLSVCSVSRTAPSYQDQFGPSYDDTFEEGDAEFILGALGVGDDHDDLAGNATERAPAPAPAPALTPAEQEPHANSGVVSDRPARISVTIPTAPAGAAGAVAALCDPTHKAAGTTMLTLQPLAHTNHGNAHDHGSASRVCARPFYESNRPYKRPRHCTGSIEIRTTSSSTMVASRPEFSPPRLAASPLSPHRSEFSALKPSVAALAASHEASGGNETRTSKRPVEAPFFLYRDFSTMSDPDPSQPLTAPGRIPNFPTKMHAILSRPDLADIVSWLPHGRSWRVWKPREFEIKVIPVFFEHAKFSSFIRQANGWGFRRLTKAGPDRNSYYHELFLRGLPHLVKRMHRPSSSQKKPVSDSATEPHFEEIAKQCPLPDNCSGEDIDCQNATVAPLARPSTATSATVTSGTASKETESVLVHCTLIQRGSQYKGKIITKEEDQIKILPAAVAKAATMTKPKLEIITVSHNDSPAEVCSSEAVSSKTATTQPDAAQSVQNASFAERIKFDFNADPLPYKPGDPDNYGAIIKATAEAKAAKIMSQASRIIPHPSCAENKDVANDSITVVKTYPIDSQEFIRENDICSSPLHFSCVASEDQYDEEEEAMLRQYLKENPHVITELQAEDQAKAAAKEAQASLSEVKPSTVSSSSEVTSNDPSEAIQASSIVSIQDDSESEDSTSSTSDSCSLSSETSAVHHETQLPVPGKDENSAKSPQSPSSVVFLGKEFDPVPVGHGESSLDHWKGQDESTDQQ